MLDTKLADDIVAAVDAGFTDQVKLTQDLVRYPSLRGQEHTAQDFLHNEMARGKEGVEDLLQYEEELLNPYQAAQLGYVDAVIAPSETRLQIIRGLRALRDKRASLPAKKHGNIPL